MYKIAISGKANSGKDTVAKFFNEAYREINNTVICQTAMFAAFADPIKEIVRLMFPRTKRKMLFGPSNYRLETIPGAFKDGKPLTFRTILQDIGTQVGRGYIESVWLDALDFKLEKANKNNYKLFIVTDVRFRNEFDHLKNQGYTMVRVKRNAQLNMSHSSEKEQDSIKDSEFDFVISNDGTVGELYDKVLETLKVLVP